MIQNMYNKYMRIVQASLEPMGDVKKFICYTFMPPEDPAKV